MNCLKRILAKSRGKSGLKKGNLELGAYFSNKSHKKGVQLTRSGNKSDVAHHTAL